MHYSVKCIIKVAGAGLFFFYWMAPGVFAAEKIDVFVSILPLKYLVEQVAGDFVDVSVMVKPGADPHTYEPKPKQMVSLSKATAYFTLGITFEDVWLPKFKAANPKMVIIHSDENIEKIPMKTHSFYPRSDHDHGLLDPHVWTSPLLVKTICINILNGLVKIDAARQSIYTANQRKFEKEIIRIHGELQSIFAGKKGLSFMVFHPAWGYFAEAYGLNQIPIEIEGKKPKPAQLKRLIEYARDHGIKIIFIQPQVSNQNAKIIAKAIDGEVVPADPLAYDWTENIRKQADKFKSALK
jgi:zinc transport system substrate-binding protein